MEDKKPWFPAKRYGWGWGPPTCWQGWVVMTVWIAAVTVGAILLHDRIGWFIAYMAVMIAILMLICWKMGEKPRWRWGGK